MGGDMTRHWDDASLSVQLLRWVPFSGVDDMNH